MSENYHSESLANKPQLAPRPNFSMEEEIAWTEEVCKQIGIYFLAPYKEGNSLDVAKKWIDGKELVVQRYNHGLAHGLRQGALAKDIIDLLLELKKEGVDKKKPETASLISWVSKKVAQDPLFVNKLEMVSSFQRSGRESEVSSSTCPESYKKFELQDSINFRMAALKSSIYENSHEISVFEESILWTNKGKLEDQKEEDLPFLRQILHAAHTFDLRRMLFFDQERIQREGLEQLFGHKVNLSDPLYSKVATLLWNRSGKYLEKTGDQDLVSGRDLQDKFFTQSKDPKKMIEAIYEVRKMSVMD